MRIDGLGTIKDGYKITINANSFSGPAQATYYNPDESIHSGPFSVILNGKKLLLENSNE